MGIKRITWPLHQQMCAAGRVDCPLTSQWSRRLRAARFGTVHWRVKRHEDGPFASRVCRVRCRASAPPEGPTFRPPCPKCGSVKRNYNMQATSGQLTNRSLDNFVAHKLSELNHCGAPELVEESNWLNTFILRTIFHFSLPPETSQRHGCLPFTKRSKAQTTNGPVRSKN